MMLPHHSERIRDGGPARRRILITGANGGIGRTLSAGLADDYELVLHGLDPEPDQADQFQTAALEDYDRIEALMDGIDTVVHLAGNPSPRAGWDDVLSANIIGFRNALEAARVQGVRRFVFASSNHTMGFYDRDKQWPVYPHLLPRPDSLYGVSKVFGEGLGRFYHEKYDIDFIALRIGWNPDHPDTPNDDLQRAKWLSDDDAVRGFRCAIEADVKFGLYYLVSDNPTRPWDTTNTMLELGYRPGDSSDDAEWPG